LKTAPGARLAAPNLETASLRLRELALADAEGMHAIYSDPETMKFWSIEPVSSLEDTRRLVEKDLDAAANGNAMFWGITLAGEDRAIGKCVLFNFSNANRRAEVGYVLNRRYWKRGLMLEAMGAVIDHAFNELGLHRLEADTDPANAGSLGLLERLGFEREGLFRQRWRVYGQWQDSVMLGLLKADWEVLRQG
jgi:RimJ/RimL family protein N-acetyltransferase